MQLFLIWRVETEVALWQPLGEMEGERVAVTPLKDQVFVPRVVEEYILLTHNRVKFADWLRGAAL